MKKIASHTTNRTRPRRRPPTGEWVFALILCGILFLCWVVWGRPLSTGSISVISDSNIDTSDERVDYTALESIIADVDDMLRLPSDLVIHMTGCDGDPNAYYEPEKKEVVVCTELIHDFNTMFEKIYDNPVDVRDASTNALVFIALHEIGHALIDILELPITGKEEDVADQLSTYLLIQALESGGQLVLDGAVWFGVVAEQYDVAEIDFADEHSLDVQRYYTLACWVYGSDPATFGDIVSDGILSPERAELCPEEFQRFSRSWLVLLDGYIQ